MSLRVAGAESESASAAGPQSVGSDTERRLAAIEETLNSLLHFISEELKARPQQFGAPGEAGQMMQDDQQAKTWKDQKDTETF